MMMLKKNWSWMITMSSSIKDKVRSFLYDKYCHHLKRKNRNTTPTFLSNTCVGGMMYHQLGLKFLSPTINCRINHEGFIEFVNNLSTYISLDLNEKVEGSSIRGVIKRPDTSNEILVEFVHDNSFKIAFDNWNRRKARVNYDDIYVIFDCTDCHFILNDDLLNKYRCIPYKKIMLVNTMGKT